MTRKCVLCKETNYRNTYSFFSAPKDPETRKKWQDAIAIENYAVTDDTYVCSKHFHKDDIVTHWVSGVPPHVITIKYKKCRLRPGAVPGRHYHLDENQAQEHLDDSSLRTDNYMSVKVNKSNLIEGKHVGFLIPRTEGKVRINNDDDHNSSLYHRCSHDFDDSNYIPKRILDKIKLSEDNSDSFDNESGAKESPGQDTKQTKWNKKTDLIEDITIAAENFIEDTYSNEKREKQDQALKKDLYLKTQQKSLESSSKSYISEDKDISTWKSKILNKEAPKENLTNNNLKTKQKEYMDNRIATNLNYCQFNAYYSACSDIGENELLFEDLLEVCTEVLLPRGWSCLVTSKGHTTTIVYLYMGMSKNGMPFTEKQVYIKSDMTLHCAAVNRKINPLIHNLIREGKHLKVQSLLDIEELIDEFDQRTVCQGIYNIEGFQEINRVKVAYKDGIKWRHILCPLLLNNDSIRCSKCISLSQMLQRKSKKFYVFSHNAPVLTKERQKIHSVRQKYRHRRRQDHRYEFVKIFKQ